MMYKFFKELENPNDFKVYLSEDELFRKRRIYNRRAWESNEFFTQYNDVFKRINIIDMLIKGTHEQLLLKHPVLNFDIQDFELENHIREFSILKSEENLIFWIFLKMK